MGKKSILIKVTLLSQLTAQPHMKEGSLHG